MEELQIPVEVALYQPDIAQNTGAMMRLCACLGVALHIIHPTGFHLSKANLRRTGLDYLEHAALREHASHAHFAAWLIASSKRLVLLTTAAHLSAYQAVYSPADVLMVGRESAGVPERVAADADLQVRVPMRPAMRSLNVATAASLVLGEAMRQTGSFAALE